MRYTAALLAGLMLCPAALPALADQGVPRPRQGQAMPLRFTDTDAADVLMAVARAFRANIVVPSDLKKPVSLNMTAHSVEEALTAIAGAAGLAWRRVGDTWVVAQPSDLRQTLEARGERVLYPVRGMSAADAAKMVTSVLPYLTARPAGDRLLLIGATDDIRAAQELLESEQQSRSTDASTTRVVTLKYAAAGQASTVLKDVYPDLKVSVVGAQDKPGGLLTVTGPRSQVAGAGDLIERIDVPTAPAAQGPVYRVYHIKYSSAPVLVEVLAKVAPSVTAVAGPEDYSPPAPGFRPISGATLGTSTTGSGINGSSGAGGAGGNSGVATQGSSAGYGVGGQEQPRKPGDRAKTVILTGLPQDVDAAESILSDVDLPPKQVMIEVKVVDTSPERAEQLGLQWSWTRFGFYEAPPGTHITQQGTGIGGDFTDFITRKLGFGAFSRVPWSFQSILNALSTDRQSKILASPRMQVTDNDDANIFIGDTIRTQVSQSSLAGTTLQVLEFPVGIILLVRPRVNADGQITMRVHPVVSVVSSVDADGIPQTSSREAETTVMVKDGETIVIGGLIRDEETKTVSEVPILAKLPIVGQLFRNRSTDHRHSEVLVFITPHIVQ